VWGRLPFSLSAARNLAEGFVEVKSLVDDPELVARRRAQLVHAAITLFTRVGYYPATVKDIADEAGVSAGLVYQYVPDKQDLLFLALQHIVQRNKQEIPAALDGVVDPLARLHISIDAYTRVIAANRHAALLTYRETKSLKPEYIEQMKHLELATNALIGSCVEECIAAGYLATTNVELLVYRIITAAHAWALKHWRLSKIVSLDEYLEQGIHACWTALLLPRGTQRYTELRREGALTAAKDREKPARESQPSGVGAKNGARRNGSRGKRN
jgi:AcrR family transcriptional regulator